LQLGLRHPVVERPLHVAAHLVGPIERSQHGHRDQATVTLAEVGMLPYVAEQDVVAKLPELGNELVHRRLFLSHGSISSCMGRDGDEEQRYHRIADPAFHRVIPADWLPRSWRTGSRLEEAKSVARHIDRARAYAERKDWALAEDCIFSD